MKRVCAVAMVGLVGASLAHARETVDVVISYVIAPAHPLPAGLSAVAVIDPAVRSTEENATAREQKWAAIAADMVEAMLVSAQESYGSPLAVMDRRNMRLLLEEQDLRAAGVIDSTVAQRLGGLLAVQGLITGRIRIQIDEDRSTKRTLDWGGLLGGLVTGLTESHSHRAADGPPTQRRSDRSTRAEESRSPSRPRRAGTAAEGRDSRVRRVYRRRPPDPRYVERDPRRDRREHAVFGPPVFPAAEVEEISRHLTVQCAFSLIDAVTGQTIMTYAPPPFQKTDRKSPDFLFGSLLGETELNPVDHFIGELVERGAREFVGRLVPVEVECAYTLEGRKSAGEKGIDALRAQDYEAALAHFQAAVSKYPDKPENLFALGATYEILGRPEEALDAYRRAAASEDANKEARPVYRSAATRLADHLGRIVRPAPPPDAPIPELDETSPDDD